MVNEMATKQKEEDPLVSELLGTVISENTGKTLSRQDYIDQIIAFFNNWWPLIAPKTKQPKNLSEVVGIDGGVTLSKSISLLESVVKLLSGSEQVNDVVYVEKPAMA